MQNLDGVTTSSTLIRRLGNPGDLDAWLVFLGRYTPLLRQWCRQAGLDHHAAEEVIQIVLVELSRKLRDFRYDPRGSFRGWLWTLCRRRIIDLARKQHAAAEKVRLFSDMPFDALALVHDTVDPPDDDGIDPLLSSLLQRAEQAQAVVRARVGARTWDAFVLIEFRATSVHDTAAALGMSYAAAYAAHERVLKMLRKEGSRPWQTGDDGNDSAGT